MQEAIVGHTGQSPEEKQKLEKGYRLKKFFSVLLSSLIIVLLVVGIAILGVNNYFVSVWISGDSMSPTLRNYEFGLMNDHAYKLDEIERYQIIIIDADRAFNNKPGTNQVIIKRVIGLPGETIRIDDGATSEAMDPISITRGSETFTLTDQPLGQDGNNSVLAHTYKADYNFCGVNYVLAEDYYFVMGDNRPFSRDSRDVGFIRRDEIIGVLYVIQGQYSGRDAQTGEPTGKKYYAPWDYRYFY